MIRTLRACFLSAFVMVWFAGTVSATVVANQRDIVNGKKNLADPLFLNVPGMDSGLGAAVRSQLTGSLPMSHTAKASILRSVIAAMEGLHGARGAVGDVSSRMLYESLLAFDLMSDKSVFGDAELSSIRSNMRQALEYYRDEEHVAWGDERWSVGAGALRIVACEALYSFAFPEDPVSDGFRTHSLRYLEKNLREGVDAHGAWLPDSPGVAGEAIEYAVIAAKVFRNTGIQNVFADPAMKRLLLWGVNIMPPQTPEAVRGRFTMPSVGTAVPGGSFAAQTFLAAADMAESDPETAAHLAWYWERCGRPVTPLGVIFYDTAIQALEPLQESRLTGAGAAVFRDNIGRTDESYFTISFGAPEGFADRSGSRHSDGGDFSFVWRGSPLVVHDGAGGGDSTEYIMNRNAWRHNVVTRQGAGDSPILPESVLFRDTVRKDLTGNAAGPADFFPDGVRQFMTTRTLDYVCGDVRLPGWDVPAAGHARHVLFIKPDALLVWDQVDSSFPLEWNCWTASDNSWAEGGVLHMHTPGNVDLQTYFAGETSLDFSAEPYPQEKTWDWPLALRAEYGRGAFTVLCFDVLRSPDAATENTGLAASILGNAVSRNGAPSLVGLVTVDSHLSSMLQSLGIPSETLSYEMAGAIDFSRYSALVIGGRLTAPQERILYDYGWKINEFASSGGSVVALGDNGLPWLSDNAGCQGTLPVMISLGKCVIGSGDSAGLKLHDDPLWREPAVITADMWNPDTALADSESVPVEHPPLASTIPVAWSDSWKVLASAPHTFPMKPYEDTVFGRPSRVRVRHPASRDYFALFIPRRIGDPTYQFDIKDIGPGFVSFADPNTSWEVRAGGTVWTDANLSVLVDSLGVRTMYAFDCTFITIGEETIRADSPMSIYYSEATDSGVIMTAANNRISCSRHQLRPHAGTIAFSNMFGSISIERETFLSTLRVRDADGKPAGKARVYQEGRFIGATDARGELPVRWNGVPPTLRISCRGGEAIAALVPGPVEAVLAE